MLNHTFRLCVVFFLSIQVAIANWEYVLEMPQLSDQEKHKVYEVVTKYHFPTVLNSKIQEELSQTDLEEIINNEPSYMKNKLTKLNSNIRLHPIPKTLYQLFAYKMVLGDIEAGTAPGCSRYVQSLNSFILPESSKPDPDNSDLNKESSSSQGAVSQIPISEACLRFAEDEKAQNLFWRINETALGYIHQQQQAGRLSIDIRDLTCALLSDIRTNLQKPIFKPKLSLKKAAKSFLQDIKNPDDSFIDSCIDFVFEIIQGGAFVLDNPLQQFIESHDWFVTKPAFGGSALNNLFASENESIMEFIEECIVNETEDPGYILYRGSPLKPDYETAKTLHLSFSDGLFGGIINDMRTGCAAEWSLKKRFGIFITEGGSKLWKVSLDKRRLMQGGYPVFIPMGSQILSIFGSDEFHHPRTQTLTEDSYPRTKYDGFDDTAGGTRSGGIEIKISPEETSEYYTNDEFAITNFCEMLKEVPNGDIFEEQIAKW